MAPPEVAVRSGLPARKRRNWRRAIVLRSEISGALQFIWVMSASIVMPKKIVCRPTARGYSERLVARLSRQVHCSEARFRRYLRASCSGVRPRSRTNSGKFQQNQTDREFDPLRINESLFQTRVGRIGQRTFLRKH